MMALGSDDSVAGGPFGAPGSSTPSYQCLPPMWGSAGGDFRSPVFVELEWSIRIKE
jgi:hypothetical protein